MDALYELAHHDVQRGIRDGAELQEMPDAEGRIADVDLHVGRDGAATVHHHSDDVVDETLRRRRSSLVDSSLPRTSTRAYDVARTRVSCKAGVESQSINVCSLLPILTNASFRLFSRLVCHSLHSLVHSVLPPNASSGSK